MSDALVYINKEKYENQASAIRVFDEFFDVMNSRTMFDKKSGRCGLGEYNSLFELIRPQVPRYLCPRTDISKTCIFPENGPKLATK